MCTPPPAVITAPLEGAPADFTGKTIYFDTTASYTFGQGNHSVLQNAVDASYNERLTYTKTGADSATITIKSFDGTNTYQL